IVPQLSVTIKPCETGTASLPGGNINRIKDFTNEQRSDHPQLANIDHLTRMYGTRLDGVLDEAGNRPDLLNALSDTGDIGAQILFAIREEMAQTLDDVVMRRTGLGQLGAPPTETLLRATSIMAAELGWNAERCAHEIENVTHSFATRSDR
ncbi:MAG TPA: glycerol-3-phosphate dehydrogenase C-terminal domain-containing protein, partial [Rhizomicrobium sp.]|nr:glycerol-3-phosphate dehydrogenase C-terminal domain-containing protein [Rhizomicrobium sp.]